MGTSSRRPDSMGFSNCVCGSIVCFGKYVSFLFVFVCKLIVVFAVFPLSGPCRL